MLGGQQSPALLRSRQRTQLALVVALAAVGCVKTLVTNSHQDLGCFAAAAGECRRRGFLVSTGLGAITSAVSPAVAADTTSALREELFAELKAGGGTVPSSSARIDAILDKLVPLNPTPRPGTVQGFGSLSAGLWRVAHAPHIAKLSGLVGSVFDPILYDLAAPTVSRGGGDIQSHVRYSLLGGVLKGWLSTSGEYNTEDGDSVSRVDWSNAWWDATALDEWSQNPADSTAAPVVSYLGKLGFVSAFAKFPVQYLDPDMCVFVFPLSGTRILALRVGSRMDVWK